MKFIPLVWAALWRNRAESALTLLALSVAFALFGTMLALNALLVALVSAVAPLYRLRHTGSRVRLRDGEWPIVGVFSCGADIIESYLVGDALTVMAARRGAGFAQVIVQLVNADAYPEFEAWLMDNPALSLYVEHKKDYDLRELGMNTFSSHACRT